MAVYIDFGSTHQLVGLPPLSDETLIELGKTARVIWKEYCDQINTESEKAE